jgi:hypothetical protein
MGASPHQSILIHVEPQKRPCLCKSDDSWDIKVILGDMPCAARIAASRLGVVIGFHQQQVRRVACVQVWDVPLCVDQLREGVQGCRGLSQGVEAFRGQGEYGCLLL